MNIEDGKQEFEIMKREYSDEQKRRALRDHERKECRDK